MRARTTPSTLFLAFLLGGLGVLILHTTVGLGGHRVDGLIDNGVYNVLMFGAGLAVIARAISVKAERTAWLVMGAGVLSWSLGELYFTLFLQGPGVAGGRVSPADGLFLAMYPCLYVALVLLVKAHLRELRISMCLDGLIAGLAAATIAAALVLPPIIDGATGDVASIAVSLAYPIGDILLLIFTIGALGITGWRPGRVWLLIAGSMLLSAIADSTYVYQTATDTYKTGTWLEGLWPAAAILLAIAAWTPWPPPRRRRIEDWRLVLVPALSLLAALGVFVYGNLHHQLAPPALILAIATVLAACARLMLTVRENLAMLVGSRRLALTDPLTGLGNRRQLMEDLKLACRMAKPDEPWQLAIYDLNGFKRYNDTFGHPAGDALLARLSDKLSGVVAAHGTAYRMGGDEFCVLISGAAEEGDSLVSASVAALCERGPGFSIGAAHGEVSIPDEGSDSAAILQLADQRLYARKDQTRESSAALQLRDVLLQAFRERYPDLQEHQRGVGALALAVGRRLGLDGEELDVLARAAELHDVGKIAIPDAILAKAGPLDEEEWRFMHRHTVLGERILTAASALAPVARLVRSSHERFDGGGYPDGLRGKEIPLGARIIFVCDAYDAMTSNRAYSRAITPSEAVRELQACAGTQFDSEVVEAFIATLAEPKRSLDSLPDGSREPGGAGTPPNGAGAPSGSADADHGEQTLALRQRYGGAVTEAAPEQG
jgi:two-component system, cell cycle response regulator